VIWLQLASIRDASLRSYFTRRLHRRSALREGELSLPSGELRLGKPASVWSPISTQVRTNQMPVSRVVRLATFVVTTFGFPKRASRPRLCTKNKITVAKRFIYILRSIPAPASFDRQRLQRSYVR
jgi:hypothetical protein